MILRTGTGKNYRIWFLPKSGISSCGAMNYPKKSGFNLYQSRHCAYITYSVKTWFLKTRFSLCISQGKIISLNWLLCYRFFLDVFKLFICIYIHSPILYSRFIFTVNRNKHFEYGFWKGINNTVSWEKITYSHGQKLSWVVSLGEWGEVMRCRDLCQVSTSLDKYKTVLYDFTLWTSPAFKVRKWFPAIFEALYFHISSDLIELYISNK